MSLGLNGFTSHSCVHGLFTSNWDISMTELHAVSGYCILLLIHDTHATVVKWLACPIAGEKEK